MFQNQRYITGGINATIPLSLQALLWSLVDGREDYLQVFRLTTSGKNQHILHTQEQPEYSAEYDFPSCNPIIAKIFVIDDGDHSTMLLADEY